MTKEEKKDEMKNRISMALKDPILQQGFEVICKNLAELENKIADIKANCDLAIEGRDIKIMELEQQIEKMKCFMNCDYSTHPSPNDCPVLNEKKKTDCKGCKYWRLRNE